MRYVQFFKDSTGYVPGSIPPEFSPCHVKPIPDVGTDAVMRLDGRFNMETCARVARVAARNRARCVGFAIYAGRSYSDSRIVREYETVR